MSVDYLPVGCFGKLPCYGDFLSGKVFLPTSLAFKDWVFKGRGGAGAVGDAGEYLSPVAVASDDEVAAPPAARPEIHETRSYRFLFGLPGSAELLAGIIRPSADSGRLRRFPFAVFAHVPRHAFAKQYALAPVGLAPTWDALREAWKSLANVATRAAFEEVLPSMSVPGPAPVEESKRAYKARLASPARLAPGESGAWLDHLMDFAPEVVKHLKKGVGESFLIDLRGAAGDAGLFEAAFWIDLMNHQFFLKRFEPVVFQEDSPAEMGCRLVLAFGGLDAAAYPAIMADSLGGGNVLRPASVPAGPGAPPAASAAGRTFQELLGTKFKGAA
jgi:hypothetical protein